MSVQDRIEKYTLPEPNSGCWLWVGACAADGYPRITIGSTKDGTKKSVRVTRLVCEEVHGLSEGMHALHKCDNPICINPDHLYPGTPRQNVKDCFDRNRRTQVRFGSDNPAARLTEKDVRAIRESKLKLKELADEYGISVSNVSMIRSGRRWRAI